MPAFDGLGTNPDDTIPVFAVQPGGFTTTTQRHDEDRKRYGLMRIRAFGLGLPKLLGTVIRPKGVTIM
jgi:hypothetical protein